MTHEYTNRNGAKFNFEVKEAMVPDDADYFGYLFVVRVGDENIDQARVYKAMVKKELCDSKEKAKIWLHTTALDFLKTILETYSQGKTCLLLPASDKWWVI